MSSDELLERMLTAFHAYKARAIGKKEFHALMETLLAHYVYQETNVDNTFNSS